MKTIQIGYFYYDLLNLYGDSGNVTMLEYQLKSKGITVSVDRLNAEETKKIEKYDVIILGSGTERALLLALMDLRQYRTPLAYAIEHGTHILATGNSFELFGKEIHMGKKDYKGLGLMDFSTEYGPRIVNDLSTEWNGQKLIGFQNHPGSTKDSKEKLFIDTPERKEGVVKNNFIGTYTIGPLLVRNPGILESYITSLTA